MTNAQAALIAASNLKEDGVDDDVDTVISVAHQYLAWLNSNDLLNNK